MMRLPPPPPNDPQQIDPGWLEFHLREAGVLGDADVVDLAAKGLGESVGFLSRMARITPRYSRDTASSPASLIIKLETNDTKLRDIADRLHAFDREIGFYRDLAPEAPTRLPRVYASGVDGDVHWLLFEDLGRLKPGDQVRGLSNRQVEMTLRHIGAVHAANWEDSALAGHAWLPEHDFYFRGDFREAWPLFRENYELRMGREATALFERLLDRQDRLDEELSGRPCTLVHGDLRADNLMLGVEGTEEEVLILDWQTATRSVAAIDVALLVGGSEPPPERAGHYHGLFSGWLDTLRSHGVEGYTEAEAGRDFRLGLLSCMRIPLQAFEALGGPDFPTPRAAQLADVLSLRHTSAAIEMDAGDVLP